MRARSFVPAVLAALALVVLDGCANGGGLRVEGAAPPDTPSATARTTTAAPSPSVRGFAQKPIDLGEARVRLLADPQLDAYSRKVLTPCTVIDRCLARGPVVDVLRNGTPQQVVYIQTLERFVFALAVLAADGDALRPIWSHKVDQPSVTATKTGDLVIESKIFTANDQWCCPSGQRVEVYRWSGGKMTKVTQKGD